MKLFILFSRLPFNSCALSVNARRNGENSALPRPGLVNKARSLTPSLSVCEVQTMTEHLFNVYCCLAILLHPHMLYNMEDTAHASGIIS